MLMPATPEPIANEATEGALIAALLIDNKQIDRVADILKSDDFYNAFYRGVYETAVHEHGLGNAVHPPSLRRTFGDEAARTLAQMCAESGVALLGVVDFANEIVRVARKRRLIEGLESVVASGRAVETFVYEVRIEYLVAKTEELLTDTQGQSANKPLSGGDCIAQALQYDGYGITSGIRAIDAALGPLFLKDLTIAAGRPGMCKTGTALSYGVGAAERNHGTVMFSLEMSGLQLGARMAADWCFDRGEKQIPFEAITSGRLTTEQGRIVARAAEAVNDLPLVIEDVTGITTAALDRMVRRHKRRFAAKGKKLELVIVDYLQLLHADRQSDSRTSDITQISAALKRIAKANDVHVLALSQLSRAVEARPDKRPRLSDLRESGSIEQDADNVLFLFRAEYYLDQEEPPEGDPNRLKWEMKKQEVAGKLEFICGKRRQGRTGIGYGHFYGNFQAVRG